MTVTAVVSLLFLKRRLLETFAMRTAAGEVYLATVEAVLVFHIAVLAERRILLIPAAVPVTVKVATVFENIAAAILVAVEISTIVKSALAVESAAFLAFPFTAKAVAILAESSILAKAIFTTFVEATTFVPFVSPAVLDFLFFRA